MRRAFLLVAALLAARASWAAGIGPQGVEDRIIVAFKQNVSLVEAKEILAQRGLEVVDAIEGLRILLAQAPSGKSEGELKALGVHPAVLLVQRDIWRKWIEALPVPFAPEAGSPALGKVRESLKAFAPTGKKDAEVAEEAPWGVKRVNAPAAWSSTQGSGVKVAVVDTGIDPNHPDLKGRVAGGYNAVAKEEPWVDDHFHGTHVAGTIAAELDGAGVAGVAPKATLYAVKVLTKEGSGSLFGIIGGLFWCAQNGIQVVNMSLGAAQEMPMLQMVLQQLHAAGAVIVAAAGNDGGAVNWPAAYPESIAVSALCPPGITNTKLCPTPNEGISSFSSRGPQVAFIAPGVLIPSTVPLSHDATGVKAYSGTSMACPHVAGLAALAVAKGARGHEAVKAALTRAAVKLPGLSPSEQGAGLVDAASLR